MNNDKVIIIADQSGVVDIKIDSKNRMHTITSLSAAMCGAFNLAGEHEKEVLNALSKIALKQLHNQIENDFMN